MPALVADDHRGGHPLLWGSLGLIGAWLALSIGLGVALPRAGQVGSTVLTVILGLFGLTLLVCSAVALTRSLRWWSLAVIPALVVLLASGVYSSSIALAAAHPPHPVRSGTPDGAREVRFSSEAGVMFAGWFLAGDNGAAVIVRHGAGSTANDVEAHARVLNEAGFSVLATDARGHGLSEGHGMELGWYGDEDITAAVDEVLGRAHPPIAAVGVLGLSMGGEEAIGAASSDPRIRAVVAEGATGRVAADKWWLSETYGLRGSLQNLLDAGTFTLTDLLSPASMPGSLDDAVRMLPQHTEVLMIAAGTVADEQLVAERLAAAAPSQVSVWVASGADHTGALTTDRHQWGERVIAFYQDALLTPRGDR